MKLRSWLRGALAFLVPFSLSVAVVLCLATPASAQQESDLPVALKTAWFPVDVAQHLPPAGGWLPLYVELQARGDEEQSVAIEAVVQEIVVDADTNRQTTEERFSTRSRFDVLPGSAVKRAWLYVWVHPKASSQFEIVLRYVVGSQVIRIGRLGKGGIVDANVDQGGVYPLLVVGGRDDEVSPFGPQLLLPTSRRNAMEISGEAVERVEAHQLPDRILGYHSFRQVVLRDLDESRLEASQLEALRRWVYLGGSVVFAPSASSAKVFDGSFFGEVFAGLLRPSREREAAFRPENLYLVDRRRIAVRNLEPYAKRDKIQLAEEDQGYIRHAPFLDSSRFLREIRSLELDSLDKRRERAAEEPEPEDPLAGYDLEAGEFPGKRLYAEVAYGAGTVGALLVDDQTFDLRSSRALRQALWMKIHESQQSTGVSRWQHALVNADVHGALKDEDRDVGTMMISGIIVLYLLLIGPGLYFFLKRRNKLPSIIWVEPVVIVIYVGLIFATGYLTKGYLTKVRLVTFFHQREGEPFALRDSWLSLFSADDEEYFIQASRGEIFSPVFANAAEVRPFVLQRAQSARTTVQASVEREVRDLSLRGYSLDRWQMGVVANSGMESLHGEVLVEAIETNDRDKLEFRVRNRLPWRIRGGRFFVHGAKAGWVSSREIEIPEIGAGADEVIEYTVRASGTRESGSDDKGGQAEATISEEVIEAFQALRDKGTARHSRGTMRLWVLLDREQADFRIDRDSTRTHKYDFYVLYGS